MALLYILVVLILGCAGFLSWEGKTARGQALLAFGLAVFVLTLAITHVGALD